MEREGDVIHLSGVATAAIRWWAETLEEDIRRRALDRASAEGRPQVSRSDIDLAARESLEELGRQAEHAAGQAEDGDEDDLAWQAIASRPMPDAMISLRDRAIDEHRAGMTEPMGGEM